MDFKSVMFAKDFFGKLCNLCDTMDEKEMWSKPSGLNLTLKDIFRLDMAKFILYLCASDGHLSREEVQFYQVVTGFGEDANGMYNFIKENNIYSTSFESEVPMIIKLVSECERNAIACGARFDEEKTVTEFFANFFKMIGDILINVDGGITYNEKRDLRIYMDTLNGYIQENCNSMSDYYNYIDKLNSGE